MHWSSTEMSRSVITKELPSLLSTRWHQRRPREWNWLRVVAENMTISSEKPHKAVRGFKSVYFLFSSLFFVFVLWHYGGHCNKRRHCFTRIQRKMKDLVSTDVEKMTDVEWLEFRKMKDIVSRDFEKMTDVKWLEFKKIDIVST